MIKKIILINLSVLILNLFNIAHSQNVDELYEKVLTLSNHGRLKTQTKQFWPDILGFKYKMSNIQAAIGLAQIERVEHLIQNKQNIFNFYYENLKSISYLKMNPIEANNKNGYWMPTVVLDRKLSTSRDQLIEIFNSHNIDARVFFWPLSTLTFINEDVDTPVSFDLSQRSLNLPSYHDITKEDQLRVINVLKNLT